MRAALILIVPWALLGSCSIGYRGLERGSTLREVVEFYGAPTWAEPVGHDHLALYWDRDGYEMRRAMMYRGGHGEWLLDRVEPGRDWDRYFRDWDRRQGQKTMVQAK